ncbi:MAG: tyrosine--tRNA ligase [Candidatus Omnitrophica bacterium]|nr:tyrosine--tRNA ligase [Candidatus Omnitrophota bacterium]
MDKIKELLERGVEKVIVKKHLEEALRRRKKLRIKHGLDATGPKIHIGRAVSLRKLREFQELGHKIVLIIGDFTAQIGDASDKQAMRKPLSLEEIKENMKDYINQIGKVLDISKVELHHNSEWLGKLKAQDLLKLSMNFTAQQMIQRRNFKERWDKGKNIGLHELDYPLLQGYDSVAIKADVEVGGFDQLFNLIAGRKIQKIYGQKQQDILTTQMLEGLDGRKMSTSWGNIITIVDEPDDMYGKLMSMSDNLIIKYFVLCTDVSLDRIRDMDNSLKNKKVNPRDLKAELAKEIVTIYHSREEALKAEKEFNRIFKKKEKPDKIREFKVIKKPFNVLDLLLESKLTKSKSEARRLVEQGGVKIDGEILKDWRNKINVKDKMVIRAGKRRFLRIRLK